MTALRKPTAADVARARELHAAGWDQAAIARMLNADGVRVTRHTIGRWVNPEMAERHKAISRAWKGRDRADGLRAQHRSIEHIAKRVQRYAEEGASIASIGAVVRADYGLDLRPNQIETLIREGRLPRKWSRRTDGEVVAA